MGDLYAAANDALRLRQGFAMVFWSRSAKLGSSHKRTSVILKRQVPIRFNESARSWFGGLPMMPIGTEWPRDSAGDPLHFIAQIASADLPSALWNGHGPRQGWLLLFVEVLKLEDEAEGGTVQVLHIDELGPEHQPPDDVPTVRHVMGDYIGAFTPEIRPGVPKLWRKWPVDIVVQEYEASDEEAKISGPPMVAAEELYMAPVSDGGITVHGSIALDRPLTWRGAFYFVEGLVRDLKPEDFKGGMMQPPEPDQNWFNEEFERRKAERKVFKDDEVGWGPRVQAARDALTAEIADERKVGWIKRAFVVLEKEKIKLEASRDEYQRKIDRWSSTAAEDDIDSLNGNLQYFTNELAELELHRVHLNQINDEFPGPDGEARLNAEIKRLGEAHLAWAGEQQPMLKRLLSHILAQDLDAPLPDAGWRGITASIEAAKTFVWQQTLSTKVLEKAEVGLVNSSRHMEMAVREDVLDIYARNNGTQPALAREFLDKIEKQLRYIDDRPHRMGDLPNPVQNEIDLDMTLLFQIASDGAMGWMWGDVGAFYVEIPPKALRRNRFSSVHAWIECH